MPGSRLAGCACRVEFLETMLSRFSGWWMRTCLVLDLLAVPAEWSSWRQCCVLSLAGG